MDKVPGYYFSISRVYVTETRVTPRESASFFSLSTKRGPSCSQHYDLMEVWCCWGWRSLRDGDGQLHKISACTTVKHTAVHDQPGAAVPGHRANRSSVGPKTRTARTLLLCVTKSPCGGGGAGDGQAPGANIKRGPWRFCYRVMALGGPTSGVPGPCDERELIIRTKRRHKTNV